MTRTVGLIINDEVVQRELPDADECAMAGVRWGDPWDLFTPAYWLTQGWMAQLDTKPVTRYRARSDATSELVFCLLGGHGITAEMATAAYDSCDAAGLIESREDNLACWVDVLTKPIAVGDRMVRYRYPNQKAKFIAGAMKTLRQEPLRLDSGRDLRNQLLMLQGVGYKTASWAARNILDSDDVAILDIHIIRAGILSGFYRTSDRVERDYERMENLFLEFCGALRLRPAALDCLVWDQMREAGTVPLRMLEHRIQGSNSATKRRSGSAKHQSVLFAT
jgi:N-glycosylase/DNA lyase